MKYSNYLVPLLKNQFYSYLAEKSKKATLNFYFKSRFLVKPSNFPIYFAQDSRERKELKLILSYWWKFFKS